MWDRLRIGIITFCLATQVHLLLEINSKDIADATKLVKELMQCLLKWGTNKRSR